MRHLHLSFCVRSRHGWSEREGNQILRALDGKVEMRADG